MSAKNTFKISIRDSVDIYEKSIVGFGRSLFLNKSVDKQDCEFIAAVYNAGIDYQKEHTAKVLKELLEG